MTAAEIIELHINSTGREFEEPGADDEYDDMDPDARFKHQSVRGKPFKKDQLNPFGRRDMNVNQDTDVSWMASSDRPWY